MTVRQRQFVLAIVTVVAVAAGAGAHPISVESDKCICEQARIANGWCGKCSVGYIAGLPIRSAMLFEEIDAHGHGIDGTQLTCVRCRKAFASDGYCEKCFIGFVDGRAYMSKLTYGLAKGHPTQRIKLACLSCRTSKAQHGWCDKCGKGLVGSFRFEDRGAFEAAVKGFGIIETAIRKLQDCSVCASAIVVNGYCPKCRVRYCDGQPVAEHPTGDAKRDTQRPHTQTGADKR